MKKTCVLLLNVGTPDSPNRGDVKRYLKEFLNDKRVIDLPWLARKLLVNGLIIPFRLAESTKIYNQLWKKHGRILVDLTEKLVAKLQGSLGENYELKYAMRYGNPSIESVVSRLKEDDFQQILVFPLFPQEAMSTTETSLVETRRLVKKYLPNIPSKEIASFFDHPLFIEAVAAQAKNRELNNYDHFVFSYHGLPNRHIQKVHPEKSCQNCECEQKFTPSMRNCYKAACYETSRLVAKQLNIPHTQYSVAFQSRLSKNWLTPFTDNTLKELAQKGNKKLLVFTPSFTIDCLETVNEIGSEYIDFFLKNGGTQLDLVPCLNDSDEAVKAYQTILENSLN